MKILIWLVLLPTVTYASIPNFKCWDIKNYAISTESGIFVTRYYDQAMLAYHYITSPKDNDYYREIIIANSKHDDGYYYGNIYQDREGNMYNDIKCKEL